MKKDGAPGLQFVGVYDDRTRRREEARSDTNGTLSELLTLARGRHIDWIVLALPDNAEERIGDLVRALEHYDGSVAMPASGHSTLLSRRRGRLGALPVALLQRHPRLRFVIDNVGLAEFLRVAAAHAPDRYGYVVTPNVDHLIRLHDDAHFREIYDAADHVLLDSRFLAHLLRLGSGRQLPVCTGSDLTAKLFEKVIAPDDRLLVIGGSAAQAQTLRRRFGLTHLIHQNPPMGFIDDPPALLECLSFIESNSPFRFCFLAVGSPQQEIVAWLLHRRGVARGLALCIGASIEFVTGTRQRAPQWMQHMGLEWLYRLFQAPVRMARRYLLRGPRVFALLGRTDWRLRTRAAHRAAQAAGQRAVHRS